MHYPVALTSRRLSAELRPGESLRLVARQHWYFPLAMVGNAAVLAILAYLISDQGGRLAPLAQVAAVAGVIWAVVVLLRFSTTEFGVTNERVIVRSGFFGSSVRDLRLESVEGVDLRQYALDVAFDSGTLVVRGGGGNRLKLPYLADAKQVREVIHSPASR